MTEKTAPKKSSKDTKIAAATIRVLEVLKTLAREPLTHAQVIELLEKNNDIAGVYSKETISKYFATLRQTGFAVEKVNTKFYLKNNIDKISLDLENVRTFSFLKNFADNFHKAELNKNLEDVFIMIENCMDENTKALMQQNEGRGIRLSTIDKADKTVRNFESYCLEKRKLKIKYHEKNEIRTYNVEPKEVLLKKNKFFLLAYNRKDMEYKEFLINNIESVQQFPQKCSDFSKASSVTYKIKNELSKVYVMRKEYETLQDFDTNSRTILNSGEDKDSLLHRLLRYGKNCEVTQPKEFKDKFLNLLDEVIAVYE